MVSQIYLILSSWLAFKGAKDDPPPLLASWNCEKSPSISLHLRLHPGSPELPHKIGNSFRNDLLLFVKEIVNYPARVLRALGLLLKKKKKGK